MHNKLCSNWMLSTIQFRNSYFMHNFKHKKKKKMKFKHLTNDIVCLSKFTSNKKYI